jgi:hypothetical protein
VRELLTSFSKKFLLALPLSPGIETISLSLFSPGQAEPNFTFNNSCFSMMEQPSLYHQKSHFLQKNYCSMTNDSVLKIAKSVVPPPISLRQLPLLFLLLNTASEDANGSNVNPDNSIPELWMHRPTFHDCPTTMKTRF